MLGQAGLGKGFGSKCTLSAWHCRASAAAVTGVLQLSRSCLGRDVCSVFFQSSMEELGRGAHSPAGKFLPAVSPEGWGLMALLPQAVLCSPPHISWTRSSSLLLFRVSTSRAQGELSYGAAPVPPPGAAPRQLEGARRGWWPPHSWPQDCWPQDSPGLSHISATTDQPLRIHPVPAPGQTVPAPAPALPSGHGLCWHHRRAAHRPRRAPCPALRLHDPLQAAAAAARAGHRPSSLCPSQRTRSRSERADAAASASQAACAAPASLVTRPCSSRWPLGISRG